MKKYLGLSVLLVVLLLFAAPVLAAPPAPGDGGSRLRALGERVLERVRPGGQTLRVAGALTSIEGDTLVVDAPRGAVTVVTDAFTRFVIPGAESPGIADLQVGDTVAASGRREGETLRANVVAVTGGELVRLQGEVAVVGAADFTLTTAEGAVTVLVNEQTRYLLPGAEQPGLAALVVGDTVGVGGVRQDGAVVARLVARARPRTAEVAGTVTAVGADSLTVARPNGTAVTFTVTDETRVLVPGVAEPGLADVQVGDRVRVTGQLVDGATLAVRVVVVPPDAAALLGEVVEVQGQVVQVRTRLEQVIAVQTDATTQWFIPGVENPTVADLRPGDTVRIGGAWIDAGNFQAWAVQVPQKARGAQAMGRILTLGDEQFTLGTARGVVTVQVEAETRYIIQGLESPGFDNLTVGQAVAVTGLRQEDGALTARVVRGRP